MGPPTVTLSDDFNASHIEDRDLVLRLLRYEDALFLSPAGQAVFANPAMSNIFSLEAGKTIQRATLCAHGFSATDASVAAYRTIFRRWSEDPEILRAVFYLRENRCLYYTSPEIRMGDVVPDSPLLELSSDTTSVHSVLAEQLSARTILAAFSVS